MSKAQKTVTVVQIGSPIRRVSTQRATLIGLGLNKMNKRSTLPDDFQGLGNLTYTE